MGDTAIYILGLAGFIAIITSLWYLVPTIKTIWGFNALLAIAAVLLNPIIHIVFYLAPKDELDSQEKSQFKKYFVSVGALLAVGVIASITIPALQPYQATDNEFQSDDSDRYTIAYNDTSSDVEENTVDYYEKETWLQEQIAEDEMRRQEIARFVEENRAPQRSLMEDESLNSSEDYSAYYDYKSAEIENPQSIDVTETTSSYSSQNDYISRYDKPTIPEAAPSAIVNCDEAGCWDTNGKRYNKGAGETYFPSTGGSCQNIGSQMECN